MNEKYKLYLGDCRNIISEMVKNGELVDMIFTSPPYFDFRKNYSGDGDGEIGSIHVDDYADWFLTFTEQFLKVLKPNGSFFLNINEKIDDGVVHPVIDELKYKLRKQGWYLVAKPYIWYKKQSMPTNCKYRAIDRYEYVFHFSNSKKPKFRADNCRVPYAESSITRVKNPLTTIDSRDGKYGRKSDVKLNENGSLPHNIIITPAESNPSVLHPAPFHVELAEWFVKVGSDENDIVLDPFNGSGTTGVASLKNNRNYIGVDMVPFNINYTKKRIEYFDKTGDCYIPKKELGVMGIDVNYYKLKGQNVNNL